MTLSTILIFKLNRNEIGPVYPFSFYFFLNPQEFADISSEIYLSLDVT